MVARTSPATAMTLAVLDPGGTRGLARCCRETCVILLPSGATEQSFPRSHGDCRTEAESLSRDPQTQGSVYCPCVGVREKWNILTKAKHDIFFF